MDFDLSQFQPTDEDKRQAQKAGLWNLAAALFGMRKGSEGDALGRGIAGYLGGSQATLKDLMAQRQSSIQQAASVAKLNKEMQMQDFGMNLVSGAMGQQGGQPSMPSNPADVQTAPYVPDGQQAGLSPAGPMPLSTPARGGLPGGWSDPRTELGFAVMGNKPVSDVVNRLNQQATSITQGPGGTLLRNGQIVGQVRPEGLVMFQNGDVSQPKFYGYPAGALSASAQQAGAVKGAETSAEEAARNPNRIVEVNMPDGTKRQLTGDQVQAALRSGQNGFPAPGIGATPNPIDQAATLAEREALGKGYATQAEKIDTDAATAKTMLARLQEMDRYSGQITTGMGAETRLQLARTAKAAGMPDDFVSAVAGGDIAKMQAFKKQSVQMAFEGARQQMGGVPRSVQEIQYQMEANPGLQLDPAANKIINDWLQGVAKFSEAKQQSKDQWLAEKGTLRGFEGSFNAQSNPRQFLQQFDETHKAPAAVAPQLAPAAQSSPSAKFMVERVLKSGDPAKIQRLRELGWVQ